jgi:hypothetical protein
MAAARGSIGVVVQPKNDLMAAISRKHLSGSDGQDFAALNQRARSRPFPRPPARSGPTSPRIVPALLTVIRVVPVGRSYSAHAQTNGGKIAPAFFGAGRYNTGALLGRFLP